MFEDPMILGLVVFFVVAIIGLVLFKRKQDSGPSHPDDDNRRARRNKRKMERESAEDEDSDDDEDERENTDTATWNAVSPNMVDDTKVSVQDVDALTEFNVYKQFGYFDKAAESLRDYLNKQHKTDPALVKELIELWVEAKKPDSLSEALNQYQNMISPQDMADFIKAGLAVDENHLGLRVLAESKLGWSVKKTAEEIGEKTSLAEIPSVPVSKKESPRKKKAIEEAAKEKSLARKMLVEGRGVISNVSNDEKGTVLAFMEPEQSVKLLKNVLSYDAATKYLNKAIRKSEKPAALLIDALTLDYRAKNINGFADHLWSLYYSLGQYGRQVKERMLGWGYSLGQHPMFGKLETNPSESILREIGIQKGLLDGGSLKKARYQALVSEKIDTSAEPRTPAERILKEVDSLLMYGQLDNAMELLEQSILEYPQESQLYITLFDLYERAEEWDRLESLLQELRSQVQTLPEEVVLAMSQLLQRFNNGSFRT